MTSAIRVLRLPAWGCVILLAVLSLLPAEEMVRTGVDGHLEHVIAYAGTAFLFGLTSARVPFGGIPGTAMAVS